MSTGLLSLISLRGFFMIDLDELGLVLGTGTFFMMLILYGTPIESGRHRRYLQHLSCSCFLQKILPKILVQADPLPLQSRQRAWMRQIHPLVMIRS
jgi:hypothetical protein